MEINKQIVWRFGDGSLQFTKVHPGLLQADETEEQLIERLVAVIGPQLRVSPVKPDLTVRLSPEREDYEASLGDGAKAEFVGVIDESEYAERRVKNGDFREAFIWVDGGVVVDQSKCKEIAHGFRRRCRSAELSPLDIEATIPSKAVEAEASRQVIRDKYAGIQVAIDTANTVDEIRAALK